MFLLLYGTFVQTHKKLSRSYPKPLKFVQILSKRAKFCPDVVQHRFSKTTPKPPETPTVTRVYVTLCPKTRYPTRWTNAGQNGHQTTPSWTKFPHERLGTPNISHRILRISHRFLRIAGQNHSIWTKSGQNKNTLSCEILKQNARVSTL